MNSYSNVLFYLFFVTKLSDEKFEPRHKMKGRSSSRKHHLRKKGHEEQEKKVSGPLSENLHLFSITSRLQSIYFTS